MMIEFLKPLAAYSFRQIGGEIILGELFSEKDIRLEFTDDGIEFSVLTDMLQESNVGKFSQEANGIANKIREEYSKLLSYGDRDIIYEIILKESNPTVVLGYLPYRKITRVELKFNDKKELLGFCLNNFEFKKTQ